MGQPGPASHGQDMTQTTVTEAYMRYMSVALAAATVLGLTVPTVLPTPAEARQIRQRAEIGQPGMHGRFQERLGLTDDQMKLIREIHAKQGESRKQLGQAMRQAQSDLRQLALTGGAEDALQAKRSEIQQLSGEMLELRVKALQEMAPILTPEQREKMAQARFGGLRGHRGAPRS